MGKLSRTVYGAERHQAHEMYFEDRHMDAVDFITDAFKDDIVLRVGSLADECAVLFVGSHEHMPKAERVNT